MAIAEFLHNVQTARNVVLPQVGGFPMPLDRDTLDYAGLKRSAPIWLTPRTVAGYDPNDFGSLSEADRDQLTATVRGFRAVAEAVTAREPNEAELKSGFGYLMIFINLLDSLMLDAEGKALLFAVHRSKITFPDFVLGLDYTLDTDWSGDPGIWIWVIVPDDVDPDSTEFRDFSTRFRKEVSRALAEINNNRLPYVHFRLLSEVNGVVNEEVA
jgi:hypothetical protein